MKKLLASLILFLFLQGIWLALSDPTSLQEVVAGAVVSLLIVYLNFKRPQPLDALRLSVASLLHIFIYIPLFIVELFKSNIDVAFRVLNPKLPINPGIVRVKTRLHSPLGRMILANSITLTPGTLTVDIFEDTLYIHWIDITAQNIEEATEKVVSKFEGHLEKIFG